MPKLFCYDHFFVPKLLQVLTPASSRLLNIHLDNIAALSFEDNVLCLYLLASFRQETTLVLASLAY